MYTVKELKNRKASFMRDIKDVIKNYEKDGILMVSDVVSMLEITKLNYYNKHIKE